LIRARKSAKSEFDDMHIKNVYGGKIADVRSKKRGKRLKSSIAQHLINRCRIASHPGTSEEWGYRQQRRFLLEDPGWAIDTADQ
jgi:hypothetical protein